MYNITNIKEFDEKISIKGMSIAIFRAEWCKDCQFINPFIDDVFAEFSNEVTAFNVNIDDFQEIKEKYNVVGIPSFVAFKNGLEINRFVSRDRKTREEISDFIKKTTK